MTGEVKLDISKITDYLYISAWPKPENAGEIESLNISLILSMHWWKPNKRLNEPPLQLLWLPTLDTPITPIPLASLWRGVDSIFFHHTMRCNQFSKRKLLISCFSLSVAFIVDSHSLHSVTLNSCGLDQQRPVDPTGWPVPALRSQRPFHLQ